MWCEEVVWGGVYVEFGDGCDMGGFVLIGLG